MSDSALRWVGQEEPNGCVAATLAMILGLSYQEAVATLGPSHADGCYSFVRQFQCLWARGYKTEPHRRKVLEDGTKTPWPPEPFAPLHIVSVKVQEHSPVYHSVIWTADGSVLDPLSSIPKTLADYHHIGGIHGVTPPQDAWLAGRA